MRQGCSLSPILFNILIADLEEIMRRGDWRGVKLEKEKVYTLSYADDVVMMAETMAEMMEDDMRTMLSILESYLDGKGLELNAEKTKVMRLRRRGGRMKK